MFAPVGRKTDARMSPHVWCGACDRPFRVKLSRSVEYVRRTDGSIAKVIAERWVCRACPKRNGEDPVGLVLEVIPTAADATVRAQGAS